MVRIIITEGAQKNATIFEIVVSQIILKSVQRISISLELEDYTMPSSAFGHNEASTAKLGKMRLIV